MATSKAARLSQEEIRRQNALRALASSGYAIKPETLPPSEPQGSPETEPTAVTPTPPPPAKPKTDEERLAELQAAQNVDPMLLAYQEAATGGTQTVADYKASVVDVKAKETLLRDTIAAEKSYNDAGVPIPTDVQERIARNRAIANSPFVTINKDGDYVVNVKEAIQAGVSDKEIKELGISQVKIASVKRKIKSEAVARKASAIVRREQKAKQQEAVTVQPNQYPFRITSVLPQATTRNIQNEFTRLPTDIQASIISEALYNEKISGKKTFNELTATQQQAVVNYFVGGLVTKADIAKYSNNKLKDIAIASAPAALAEPTPIGEVIIIGMLLAAGIATTIAQRKAISQAVNAYIERYNRLPDKSEVYIETETGVIPLQTVGVNIDTSLPPFTASPVDTKREEFIPMDLKTKLPVFTPKAIAGGAEQLVPVNIKGKIPPQQPPFIGGTGFMPAASYALANTAAVRQVATQERWKTWIVNYPVAGGTAVRGSYIRGEDIYDLDRNVFAAYSRGALSKSEYQDYLFARDRYLKAKAGYDSTVIGKISNIPSFTKIPYEVTAAAMLAALNTATQASVQGKTIRQIKTAAIEAVETATIPKELTKMQVSQLAKTAVKEITKVDKATLVKTSALSKTLATPTTATAIRTLEITKPLAKEATKVAAAAATTASKIKMPTSDRQEKIKKHIEEHDGMITWRQGYLRSKGDRWDVIKYPYQSEDDHFISWGKPPLHALVVRGADSAFKTATLVYGSKPNTTLSVFKGLGAFTLQISPTRTGISLDYTPISKRDKKVSMDKTKFPLGGTK